jgi:hypothetical protein
MKRTDLLGWAFRRRNIRVTEVRDEGVDSPCDLFDRACQILASPMPRRRSLKLAASAMVGAALAELGIRPAWGQASQSSTVSYDLWNEAAGWAKDVIETSHKVDAALKLKAVGFTDDYVKTQAKQEIVNGVTHFVIDEAVEQALKATLHAWGLQTHDPLFFVPAPYNLFYLIITATGCAGEDCTPTMPCHHPILLIG